MSVFVILIALSEELVHCFFVWKLCNGSVYISIDSYVCYATAYFTTICCKKSTSLSLVDRHFTLEM